VQAPVIDRLLVTTLELAGQKVGRRFGGRWAIWITGRFFPFLGRNGVGGIQQPIIRPVVWGRALDLVVGHGPGV
tara:strand:+ start:189 stop:410 length:222 start_codon:yes stop_codon:yes gene_type:complete